MENENVKMEGCMLCEGWATMEVVACCSAQERKMCWLMGIQMEERTSEMH